MNAAYVRPDFDVVTNWVPQGASVLDLGCGDGELLARLQRERGSIGYGVEIVQSANSSSCGDARLHSTLSIGRRFGRKNDTKRESVASVDRNVCGKAV